MGTHVRASEFFAVACGALGADREVAVVAGEPARQVCLGHGAAQATDGTDVRVCLEQFVDQAHIFDGKKEWPPSERLVNAKLDLRGLNLMRDWRVALREYLDDYDADYLA